MEQGEEQDRQAVKGELPGADHFPEEEREQLLAKLEEANRKADEYLSLLQRVQADFVNYRRRTEQARGEDARNAKAEVIGNVVPVLDDFERALASLPVGAGGLPWVQGVTMIERKLRALFEAEGVEEINPLGQEFNPWEHEAALDEETDAYEPGKVIQVLRPGYKLDSKIIRPAQVKVAKAKLPPADEE
jgi:molecular chaperone GrpE